MLEGRGVIVADRQIRFVSSFVSSFAAQIKIQLFNYDHLDHTEAQLQLERIK